MQIAPPRAEPAQIVTILTTEHFALQSARSETLADAQSRSTVFLTSLSSALIALAFVGQSTKMGALFYTFAYVIFATLYVMGIVTVLRVFQTAVEDSIHARGINRIRQYYIEVAPQLEPYFIHTTHDDMKGMIWDMGVSITPLQTYLSTGSMLSFISSVMLAVLVSLFARVAIALPVGVAVSAAVTLAAANFFVLQKISAAFWAGSERRFPPQFPSKNNELRFRFRSTLQAACRA